MYRLNFESAKLAKKAADESFLQTGEKFGLDCIMNQLMVKFKGSPDLFVVEWGQQIERCRFLHLLNDPISATSVRLCSSSHQL